MSKEKKVVYSARVNSDIMESFKNECDRLNVPHSYIISEYMKKFVVLNVGRESYESPILEDNKDLDNILD